MIPNITRGTSSSFTAALRYDLNEEKGYLLDTNCASRDADGIAHEMQVQASSSRAKEPMHHVSLRLVPGEKLSDEQWRQVREKYMQKMGFNESHQFSACHHTDIKDGDHLHLVINRVDSKGKALNDFQEKKRSQQACREIEKEMGLTQLKDHQQQADGKMNTIKAKLHESIAEAKANGGSIEQLKASLEKRGLELKLHVQSTGRIQGASISDIESGKTWKMSEVYGGKGGFKGIQNELAGKSFEKKAIKTPSHEKSNPLIHSQGSGSNGQTQIPSGGIDSGLIEGAETKEEVEYLIYLKNQQQSKSGGMQAKLGREMER